jgi:hypothetical protein
VAPVVRFAGPNPTKAPPLACEVLNQPSTLPDVVAAVAALCPAAFPVPSNDAARLRSAGNAPATPNFTPLFTVTAVLVVPVSGATVWPAGLPRRHWCLAWSVTINRA